jgi:hypothetical protein
LGFIYGRDTDYSLSYYSVFEVGEIKKPLSLAWVCQAEINPSDAFEALHQLGFEYYTHCRDHATAAGWNALHQQSLHNSGWSSVPSAKHTILPHPTHFHNSP